MTADRIERWASLLADYCLRVQPGETMAIGAELEARELVEACYREVVRRGAFPLLRLDLPGLAEFFLQNASDEQLAHCPPTAMFEAEHCDGRIRIAAESDTRSMSRIDPARQAAFDRARHPIRRAAAQKRWVLTQFPTAAYAAEAGMSLPEYEDFVAAAMFLDREDPAEAWRELGRRQAGLIDYLKNVSTIRIAGEGGTDLTLDVGGRTWINSDGRRNMPSGEVFTGPVEESARGRIACSFPVCRGGRVVSGIALELDGGRVVKATAEDGEAYLHSMLNLDAGARRFGELGIGLNDGIQRFTGSILYDEKIGGTVHLALGQSYPETGGVNESALHWDLIVDLRRGGRVWADGALVMEDGRWRVG
jgi:aminopeptidase